MFSRCLFCATSLSHSNPVHDAGGGINKQITITKDSSNRVFITGDKKKKILTFQGDSPIQQQLQTFFILRNILKISKEKLCIFLLDNEYSCSGGDGDTDLWTQLQYCLPCGELVFQYYQTEKKPRLETAMKRIRNQLKEKIKESKDVEGPTPGSIWGRIRNHVLRKEEGQVKDEGSSSTPHQVFIKVEMADREFLQEEEDEGVDWDMANAHVKTEYNDETKDAATYETHPTSELGLWEPHLNPSCNFNPPIATAKPKSRKFRYVCPHCPYKNVNSAGRYEAHIQVHFEGSSAIPCPECGVFVFAAKLSEHLKTHRRRESRQKQRNPPSPYPEPPPEPPKKGPPYSVRLFKKGVYGQKCRDCPFRLPGRGVIDTIQRMEAHVLLHQKGSLGVPCPECKCYQPRDKLSMHRSRKHGLPKGIRKKMALSSPVGLGREDSTELDQLQSFQTSFDAVDNYDDRDSVEWKSEQEVTVVKTEVVDLGHLTQADYFLPEGEEEEVEESEPVPIYQPPFFLSFFGDEAEPQASFLYPPPKAPVRKKQSGSSSRWNKPNVPNNHSTCPNPNYTIKQRKRSPKVYMCVHCPFSSSNIKHGIEDHVLLHEPGSSAFPCPDCGIYVLPERFTSHNATRHPQIRSKLIRRKMMELTKPPRPPKTKAKMATNPHYKRLFNSGFYKGTVKFKCNYCYYRTSHVANIETHIKLHEEGSTAIPCEKCGWFVLPEHMEVHDEHNHATGKRLPPLIQCKLCPFETKKKRMYDEHQRLHAEGSGASQCEDCGCYVKQPMDVHRKGPLCAKLRKRKLISQTMKEDENSQEQNRNESESEQSDC